MKETFHLPLCLILWAPVLAKQALKLTTAKIVDSEVVKRKHFFNLYSLSGLPCQISAIKINQHMYTGGLNTLNNQMAYSVQLPHIVHNPRPLNMKRH